MRPDYLDVSREKTTMYQNLSCTAIKNSESTVFPMGNEAPNVKNGYVEVSMMLLLREDLCLSLFPFLTAPYGR
jgi:hypothetical protein